MSTTKFLHHRQCLENQSAELQKCKRRHHEKSCNRHWLLNQFYFEDINFENVRPKMQNDGKNFNNFEMWFEEIYMGEHHIVEKFQSIKNWKIFRDSDANPNMTIFKEQLFTSQRGNSKIFLSLRCNMKSILGIVEVEKLPFLRVQRLWILYFGEF